MCNFRKRLSRWFWPGDATVVGIRMSTHTAYAIHSTAGIYLLDDYSDLFGVPVAHQWVNTVTGQVVGHRKSLRLSAILAAAVAAGTVVGSYDAP